MLIIKQSKYKLEQQKEQDKEWVCTIVSMMPH